eukprot:TRINITY_DN10637_c0_g2_i1.p1 TRINITY_DN10637_c0_g2~~TRINITY_DN10637_c0_g2_i1.p1  ORF type:complete len:159 (-),score=30.58 TRINITY_DN10637_c0_g2_i1:213-689(-)
MGNYKMDAIDKLGKTKGFLQSEKDFIHTLSMLKEVTEQEYKIVGVYAKIRDKLLQTPEMPGVESLICEKYLRSKGIKKEDVSENCLKDFERTYRNYLKLENEIDEDIKKIDEELEDFLDSSKGPSNSSGISSSRLCDRGRKTIVCCLHLPFSSSLSTV